MTAPSPTIPPAPAVLEGGDSTRLPLLEIDRSCRLAVSTLLAAAVFWLALGGLLGVIAAIKAHGPGFLPGPAWLTYGRIYPVAANAFVYGFVVQAGLAVALWMISRLGNTLLEGPLMITGAALFWNLGVALGLGGILAGDNTGHPWLEMPGMAASILFCAFVLIAAWAVVNLHGRRERSLYVSQWFILAGLLWFPWIYSTAALLVVFRPVRGLMQAVVSGWYGHNLLEIVLGSFALASIFYFLPKLLRRPLHSRGLALFGFWTLILFGSWATVAPSVPAPNWISAVTVVARVFVLIPVIAIAISWLGTISGQRAWSQPGWVLRFILVAAGSFILAALLETFGLLPSVHQVTAFTLYGQGVTQLRVHGFLIMALTGAIYYIAPRVAGADWPSSRLMEIHFWSALAGLALSVVALVVGGFVQGAGINQAQTDFMSVVRKTVPFLGTNTLGMTLLLVGYVAFLINLARLLMVQCPCSLLLARVRPARNGRAKR